MVADIFLQQTILLLVVATLWNSLIILRKRTLTFRGTQTFRSPKCMWIVVRAWKDEFVQHYTASTRPPIRPFPLLRILWNTYKRLKASQSGFVFQCARIASASGLNVNDCTQNLFRFFQTIRILINALWNVGLAALFFIKRVPGKSKLSQKFVEKVFISFSYFFFLFALQWLHCYIIILWFLFEWLFWFYFWVLRLKIKVWFVLILRC